MCSDSVGFLLKPQDHDIYIYIWMYKFDDYIRLFLLGHTILVKIRQRAGDNMRLFLPGQCNFCRHAISR